MSRSADILVIGSGIACTASLTALFQKLLSEGYTKQLQIVIVEKHPEFWKGIPYGKRSSQNGLTITSIQDFFTADVERVAFFEWFKPKMSAMLSEYEELGGEAAKNWLMNNSAAIAKEDWEHVYLPRYIPGEYIYQKFFKLYNEAEQRGLAKIDIIIGEAIEVKPIAGNYVVKVEITNGAVEVGSLKVVLAIGSAPERVLTNAFDNDPDVAYFNSAYEPGMDANVDRLEEALERIEDTTERNVLIVGTNAAAIELLYLIANRSKLIEQINSITMLSKGGILPYHITYDLPEDDIFIHLEELKQQETYTFDELIEAATKDIRATREGAICIPYIDKLVGILLGLLKPLNNEAKKKFYGIHGVQLARLFRRSGPDYKNTSEKLLQAGKLKLLKGRYLSLQKKGDAAMLTYTDPETGEAKELPNHFKAVFNCTGSEDLDQSPSRLIRSLLHDAHCKMNLSRKALEVSETLEAAPNLYVIGPLLGGNYNKLLYFWHLENASRIIYLAPYLANELLRD